MALASLKATCVSINHFAATLPAFKALYMVTGAAKVIDDAMDDARASDDQDRFNVCMDIAERALGRLEEAAASLRAEIAKASGSLGDVRKEVRS